MSREGEGGIEESSTEPSSSQSQPSHTSTTTRTTGKPPPPPVSSPDSGGVSSSPVIPTSTSQPPSTNASSSFKPPDPSTSDATYPSTPEDVRPKQVIAVNASKGPAAFFNLARKFLVADEICDLSALEGAIVAAADAAHLLERSQLATIIRVQTSYAAVEPKRRRQPPSHTPPHTPGSFAGRQQQQQQQYQQQQQQQGRDLRRARIVITVKRTEQYKRWLDENPYQAVLAGDGAVEEEEATADAPSASYVR